MQREETIVYMDIAIYKCIVDERMEKIKKETYGQKSYYRKKQTMNWKMSMNMILNVFL